jgi:hypothetical protein
MLLRLEKCRTLICDLDFFAALRAPYKMSGYRCPYGDEAFLLDLSGNKCAKLAVSSKPRTHSHAHLRSLRCCLGLVATSPFRAMRSLSASAIDHPDLSLIEDAQVQSALRHVDKINAAPQFWRRPCASQLAKLNSRQFGQ